MVNEENQAVQIKSLYGGVLTEDEKRILLRIRELFTAVAEKRAEFNLIAEVVAAKLLSVIGTGMNPNAIRNIDARIFAEVVGTPVPFLADNSARNTAQDIEFARDVVGAIDFALRNDVSFGFIVNMLSHDLGAVFSHGGLAGMLSANVLPKCHGYREFTAEVVGDPEAEEG